MSLLDVLRSAVTVIDQVTKPLQCTVSYSQYVDLEDGFGTPNYPSMVAMRAIVDWKLTKVNTNSGIVEATRPLVMFLDIAALVAATGGAGISVKDRIVLQDGTTGPLMNLQGFIDAGTGKPIATECFIG